MPAVLTLPNPLAMCLKRANAFGPSFLTSAARLHISNSLLTGSTHVSLARCSLDAPVCASDDRTRVGRVCAVLHACTLRDQEPTQGPVRVLRSGEEWRGVCAACVRTSIGSGEISELSCLIFSYLQLVILGRLHEVGAHVVLDAHEALRVCRVATVLAVHLRRARGESVRRRPSRTLGLRAPSSPSREAPPSAAAGRFGRRP